MDYWLGPSGALLTVRVLFWGSVVTSFASFATDLHLHLLLRAHWKVILFCIALVVLWRVPTDGQFFHGMEYEDSYVYTVAGRQMALGARIEPLPDTLPYSITVCTVGSLTSCQESGNFPEHLIGYPYVLSIFSKILGYTPSIGSLVNVLSAAVVDVLVFLLSVLISDDVVAACGAALIFAITPVFAVWGLETSAEPISNGCITVVLWFCLRQISRPSTRDDRWQGFAAWCAFTATLLFSLTVKRENLLLPICLPTIAAVLQFANRRAERFNLRNAQWIVLSAALALAFSFCIKIVQTTGSETALLNLFPLTFTEMAGFLVTFVRSFFIVQWYGGAAILVLVGAIVAWHLRRLELFPFALFVVYVLLYAIHIRSYYDMRSGHSDPRTALRFSMSLMSLWSILAGIGIASIGGLVRRSSIGKRHAVAAKWIAVGMVASAIAVSYYGTTCLREDAVEDEFRIRIEPSLAAVRVASDDRPRDAYILTLEPLIPQMYSQPSVDILSLPDLDGSVMGKIGFSQSATDLLYLDEEIHHTSADTERYKAQMAYIDHLSRCTLRSTAIFSIIRLDAAPPHCASPANVPAGSSLSEHAIGLMASQSAVSRISALP
jgi:hypothetical protein